MRQMTTTLVVSPSKEGGGTLRATQPVRQMDTREKRRKRITALSDVAHAIYGEAFKRLAK